MADHINLRAQVESLGQHHIEPTTDLIWALQKVYFKKLLSISPFFLKF